MKRSRVMNLKTGLTLCPTCGGRYSWGIQVCPFCARRQEAERAAARSAPVVTDEQTTARAAAIVDALDRAAAETGVKAEWLSAAEVAQLEVIDQGRRDWNDIKGDCDN